MSFGSIWMFFVNYARRREDKIIKLFSKEHIVYVILKLQNSFIKSARFFVKA